MGPAERSGRPPGVAAAFPERGPWLYRWRRLTAGAGPKRVEQASEYAISEAFTLQKSRYRQGSCGPVTSLETVEQLQDHDEAYEEARELLSNWMKSKLQVELMNDGEEEVDSVLLEKPSAAPLKYERFDDLCSYLEHELESSTVQEYLQHLLQSEAVNCGIVKNLRLEDIKEKRKLADPRIIMELRHKQVKENRMRRQKALELQRQEKFLKKSILSEAKFQAQEEDRRKALKAKKEEEEMQREMVKLRKEMAEKRHTMAEAQRMEGKIQEKSQKLSMQEVSVTAPLPLVQKKEEQEEEKQRRVQELLRRIHINKQRCMQRHFSAWLKVILEHRIKMGKARALDDWKCQLKALRAWRNYAWAQKVEQETQQLEVHLQDQNRKPKFAWEITLKHAALTAQDQAVYRNRIAALPQKFHTLGPKTAPAYGSRFEHRHAFQQRLIEEQRRQLQKQQELILELQENQRLSRVKEEAAQAMAKELEKQKRLEKEQQLQRKARDHYEKVLLRKLGMVPWKRLREQAKENLVYQDYLSTLEETASTFRAACLMKKYFWAWFDLVMEEKSTLWEKLKIATEHSNKCPKVPTESKATSLPTICAENIHVISKYGLEEGLEEETV
ncbi:hypothetical protein llap_11702 [Limosa lapponica baueri]|uniref:Coiled-coil domain-containing protein 191 n=1 Tax=Limosa lapponica baueri TaxID=1758121 RepID=A0A2I0TW07_LIMLA|nr:hypothetical protein llap_11702 [Limosa lapponica baueri]